MRRSFASAATAFGRLFCDVVLVEKRLPLQIRQLDEIAIDQPHKADAGPDDLIGRDRTERAQIQQAGRATMPAAPVRHRQLEQIDSAVNIDHRGAMASISRLIVLKIALTNGCVSIVIA